METVMSREPSTEELSLDQRQRCVETTALMIDLSKAVQCIEIRRIVLKNGAEEAFGLA